MHTHTESAGHLASTFPYISRPRRKRKRKKKKKKQTGYPQSFITRAPAGVNWTFSASPAFQLDGLFYYIRRASRARTIANSVERLGERVSCTAAARMSIDFSRACPGALRIESYDIAATKSPELCQTGFVVFFFVFFVFLWTSQSRESRECVGLWILDGTMLESEEWLIYQRFLRKLVRFTYLHW